MRLDFDRVHIVGVGGAGMSAIARLLVGLRHSVSGSDLRGGPGIEALRDIGVAAQTGHVPELATGADLVIASSAVPEYDEELQAAEAAGIPVWRRPQALAAFSSGITTYGATGTHGKTTATALLLTAIRATGLDPSFIMGGEIADIGANGHLGSDDLLVIEADEAFRTFESIDLNGLVVTNAEPEHIEHFGTPGDLLDSFKRVASSVDGPVVACLDDKGSAEVAASSGAVTYGTDPEADWLASDIEPDRDGMSFALCGRGDPVRVYIPQPGLHMVLNAAGALSLFAELGYDLDSGVAALARYRGVGRRWEHRGTVAGVTIIDDYAHHPTEVAATLEAALSLGAQRLIAVFQPHLYSRTERFSEDFARALSVAEVAVVTDVFGGRETPVPGVSGALITDRIDSDETDVIYVRHRAELVEAVSGMVEPGDLVVSMGAGDITLFPTELTQRLGS